MKHKHTLMALLCMAALHALPQGERFADILKEANAKMWDEGEWEEMHPTKQTLDEWREERMRQLGLHFLMRYTELFEREPEEWDARQEAYFLWHSIQNVLEKPEDRKTLDNWRAQWLGDYVIGRKFYREDRLPELAAQFPDIQDTEKIARTLMAEFPMRREPYCALLSIARRKGAEAYEATLREILNSADTHETVKAYLQRKPGEKIKDNYYSYGIFWGDAEDIEFHHYEIREAQLYARLEELIAKGTFFQKHWRWLKGEIVDYNQVPLALIAEFPNQVGPYMELFSSAIRGKRIQLSENHITYERDINKARAWMLKFVKGPAPDVVKAELANHFIRFAVGDELGKTFRLAILSRIESYLPAPREEKAWLEKHVPQWRVCLEAYADFMDVLLQRVNEDDEDEMSSSRWDAIHLLDALLEVTDEPEYRRHLKEINAKWLALTGWSEEERMALRSTQLFAQEADARGEVVRDPRLIRDQAKAYPPEVYEKVTRTLIKEFPQQKDLYDNLTHVAERQDPWDRALLQEILDNAVSEHTKEWAQQRIAQMNRVGQPFELKGIAINMERRERMPLQQMKGNVTLIHFWTTWDESCIEELPRIKGLYDTYHAQGFEVISISHDKTPMAAEAFLEQNPLPWPQQWHQSREDFDLRSFPTLWLVDKQGIVRDVNAQNGTEQKIKKLLAEP
ncbi:MAG: TlpA family protein disulfide reductase [Kiritimatiellaeota bacterium]|nr:TlpA family protein disulfide reductase [Kiritimatiellota bacterium]